MYQSTLKNAVYTVTDEVGGFTISGTYTKGSDSRLNEIGINALDAQSSCVGVLSHNNGSTSCTALGEVDPGVVYDAMLEVLAKIQAEAEPILQE